MELLALPPEVIEGQFVNALFHKIGAKTNSGDIVKTRWGYIFRDQAWGVGQAFIFDDDPESPMRPVQR